MKYEKFNDTLTHYQKINLSEGNQFELIKYDMFLKK
jgi:hypothetical protein